MIITVPEYKKIYYNEVLENYNKPLNEAKVFDVIKDMPKDNRKQLRQESLLNYIKSQIPVAERVLKQLDVFNYRLTPTLEGLFVDVDNNLFLPNKNLNTFDTDLFIFREVKGDVNFNGNDLTNWELFPRIIHGNCYAQFNYLKNFDGAPQVLGRMFANRQHKKPRYPLTQENYELYTSGELSENTVYLIDEEKFGVLKSINEDLGTCSVLSNGKIKLYNLDRVEYFGDIKDLFI